MNTVLIIQARMGSTRLPGKSTLNLGGKPLIGWVIHRLKKTSQVDKIVLSTTTKTEDDILEKIGLEYEIDVFRGSENDLVDRYYQAAKKYKANLIVRVPGDNALPEPKEIDRVINYHNNNGTTNKRQYARFNHNASGTATSGSLDINTKEQYEFVSEMYEYMTANYIEFGIREVIKWYDNIYKK